MGGRGCRYHRKNKQIKGVNEMALKMYEPSEKDKQNIENNFKHHPPIDDLGQNEKYTAIRAEFKKLAEFLTTFCPPSRELSLSLTNLEQAQFWANASIARNEKE
jgi:hypothetical protein